MCRIFDRYLFRIFIRAFVICFFSLVGLYIVIDAFSNLDEFSERSDNFFSVILGMGAFYCYRISLFYDHLAGVITTIAAMFTITWIQRTNELTPLLAAGVPVYRVIAPVFAGALVVNSLVVLNQEKIIPHVADQLQMRHDDPGDMLLKVQPAFDHRGILMSGGKCHRDDSSIRPANITLPPTISGVLLEIRAEEAVFQPETDEYPTGGWILREVQPKEVKQLGDLFKPIGRNDYFFATNVTYDQLSRSQQWFQYVSTPQLLEELQWAPNSMRMEMLVLIHSRLTRPLGNLTLLFMALPFVLSGRNHAMVKMMGMSLVLSVSFHIFSYFCHRLGTAEILPATLAAWLPVLLFGTLAISMADLVKS